MSRIRLLVGLATLIFSLACVDLAPPWSKVRLGTGGRILDGSPGGSLDTPAGFRASLGGGGGNPLHDDGAGRSGDVQVQVDTPVGIVTPDVDEAPEGTGNTVPDGPMAEGGRGTGVDLGAGGSLDAGGKIGTGGSLGTYGGGGAGTGGSGREVYDAAVDFPGDDAPAIQGASTFHCGNWVDQRDNFVNGNLVLSGLSAADDYATVLAKGNAILGALKSSVDANSVRVPINEPTASGTWWNAYKGVIDASLAQGMKVILAYWAWQKNGKEDNRAAYFAMWKTVVDAYVGNDLVYFEIFNNPFGYAPSDFNALAALWLSTYPAVPKGRVVVAGSGYNDRVFEQGADSRLTGTLLSLQIYPFYSPSATANTDWTKRLKTSLGGYESRTIVTAWGAPMTTGTNYSSTGEGDNSMSFMSAIPTYLRNNKMGSCSWPMLRTADTWSLTTLRGSGTSLSLDINNASGLARIKSAFNL